MNNLPNPKTFSNHTAVFAARKKEEAVLSDDEVLQQIAQTMQNYDKEPYQTFKHQPYRNEAVAIAPMWVWQQASKEALERFRRLTTFDSRNNTLIIKIFDYSDRLISYKRRRLDSGKWVTAKNTHPNGQCLISDIRTIAPVYLVEGHHDYITSVLMGLNVLALPTVNYTQFNQYEISFLQDREVVFIPDIGDDGKSIKSMQTLAEQLADRVKIISLSKFLEYEGIKSDKEKLDLSAAIELWTSTAEAFRGALLYYGDRGSKFFGYEKEIF